MTAVKLPMSAANGLVDRSAMRNGAPSVMSAGPLMRAALSSLAETVAETAGCSVYCGHQDGQPWTVEIYATDKAALERRTELGDEPLQRPGGRREGAGRKKGSRDKEPRASFGLTEVVRMRCSPATKELIRTLACEGESDSDVLRAGLFLLARARGRDPSL